MATYNGARFIKQQIDSILPQLGTDDELIISDDGSTDGTLDILASYNDARIKVFHHKKSRVSNRYKNHRYATENFENALFNAKGDFIFLSDQDDVWLLDKVSHCMELLDKYDCIVHNYQIIDIDGKLQSEKGFPKNPLHKSLVLNVLDNHFRGCCMAFKSDFLKIILPIPNSVIGHDYWIGTLIAHFGAVYYEMKPLIKSRRYAESVSAKRNHNLLYKIIFRCALFYELEKRHFASRKKYEA